jgi:alkylresorcinol/alkylpyrone synthase
VTESSVVIGSFTPIQLQKPVRQEHLLNYYAWLMASARCAASGADTPQAAGQIMLDVQEKIRRYGISPNFVSRRQFNVFPDSEEALGVRGGAPQLPEGFEDLLTQPEGPSLGKRMERFEALALAALGKWYGAEAKAPDDLIHVTCSGYVAPSPAQRFVSQRRWSSTTVLHSYGMGCYGAFPAIRSAVGLLTSPVLSRPEGKRRVDIMHTEYLSGHVTTLKDAPGDIIDMTLFGDGFIGYSAYPEDVFRSSPRLGPGLRVLSAHEEIIPDSLDEMTWKLGAHQFDMHLSKNVPLLIRENVLGFARNLCMRAGLDFERTKENMFYAIHPGGPKILDHTRDVLGLSEDKLVYSRRVFQELGNMCSAAVPYILKDVLEDPAVPSGAHVLSMGFGPGLTASGLMLQKV